MQRTMRYNVFVYAKISGKNLQINNQVGCNTIMDWKFKIKKKRFQIIERWNWYNSKINGNIITKIIDNKMHQKYTSNENLFYIIPA